MASNSCFSRRVHAERYRIQPDILRKSVVTADHVLVEDIDDLLRYTGPSRFQTWCSLRIQEHLVSCSGPLDEIARANSADLRDLRRWYNAATPINYKLPVELLCEVFGYCMQPAGGTGRTDAFAFMSVCSYWRVIGLAARGFWAESLMGWRSVEDDKRYREATVNGRKAIVDERVRCIGLFLSRAGRDYPLNLSFRGFPTILSQTLQGYTSSITSLEIRCRSDEVEGIVCILTAGAPLLESLSLDPYMDHCFNFDCRQHTTIIPLTSANSPRLRSLCVPYKYFKPESVMLTLTDLELFDCCCYTCHVRPSTSLNFAAIMDTLRSLPLLQSIKLSIWSDSVSYSPPTSPPVMVEFPALRNLYINTRDESFSSAILTHLKYPADSTYVEFMQGTHEMRQSLPQDLRSFVAISHADHVEVTVADGKALIDVYTNSYKLLRTYIPHDEWVDLHPALTSLATVFRPFETVTHLALAFCDSAPDEQQWEQLLRVFPQLLQLSVDRCDAREYLMPALMRVSPNSGQYLCPRLRALGVCWLRYRDIHVWRGVPEAHALSQRGCEDRVQLAVEIFSGCIRSCLEYRAHGGIRLTELRVILELEVPFQGKDGGCEWDASELERYFSVSLTEWVEEIRVAIVSGE